MSYDMTDIEPLDPCLRARFLRRAYRLISAHEHIHRIYHGRPVQRDMFAEVDAVAAWSVVTCSYSGIEQAIKCLLQMEGTYVDRLPREGGDRHHNIRELFDKLTVAEKRVLRVAFTTYRSLHDYIPKETADDFLKAIDNGYPTWRYFLMEGDEERNWPPTTHPGAMIEIWSALSDIIQARQFTNHGLQTVKQRIGFRLREVHEQVCLGVHEGNIEAIVEVFRWLQSGREVEINAYADLLYRSANDDLLTFEAQTDDFPTVLTTSPVLRGFVDCVGRDETDNDLIYFVQRAKVGRIVWNACESRFEDGIS